MPFCKVDIATEIVKNGGGYSVITYSLWTFNIL